MREDVVFVAVVVWRCGTERKKYGEGGIPCVLKTRAWSDKMRRSSSRLCGGKKRNPDKNSASARDEERVRKKKGRTRNGKDAVALLLVAPPRFVDFENEVLLILRAGVARRHQRFISVVSLFFVMLLCRVVRTYQRGVTSLCASYAAVYVVKAQSIVLILTSSVRSSSPSLGVFSVRKGRMLALNGGENC